MSDLTSKSYNYYSEGEIKNVSRFFSPLDPNSPVFFLVFLFCSIVVFLYLLNNRLQLSVAV